MARTEPVLTINLRAIQDNYQIIRNKVAGVTAAVVKANGYGLGAQEISLSIKSLNCNDFFVFTPEEGLLLRQSLPDSSIYILCGCPKGWEPDYIEYNLIPALPDPDSISRYRQAALNAAKSLPIALQFDTGMNRLGLGRQETSKLLEQKDRLDGLNIKLIMSHFACADEKDHPETGKQFERFVEINGFFPSARKSLSNSSGIFRDKDFHFDLVRPGMALYGLNPTPEVPNPMQPTVKLEVPVLQVRNVMKDDIIGYSATYRFEKDMKVATVMLGYADGFLRSLSNGGTLYWQGKPCPVRGRVSMDLVTVSLEHIGEGPYPKPGDFLEVLGEHQNADDLAAAANTIGYEILTSLGARYRRDYIR